MNTCTICGRGHIYLVRGRVLCTVCMRRTCGKCHQPILNKESMASTGKGEIHLGECPDAESGGTMKTIIPPVRDVARYVDPGMR